MLYTSHFPSSPDSKHIKMLSVLNKRFLFVSMRVIERLHWFSVVTIVNSGLHLGCLIKQKIPVAVNNHTAQRSPIPCLFIWKEFCRQETRLSLSTGQETLLGSLLSLVWWLGNSTCVTHLCLPPCPLIHKPPFFGGPTTRLSHHHSLKKPAVTLPTTGPPFPPDPRMH